jgi:hypothetical protein
MYQGQLVATQCWPAPDMAWPLPNDICATTYAQYEFGAAVRDVSKGLIGCLNAPGAYFECPAKLVNGTHRKQLTACLSGLTTCPDNYPHATILQASGVLYDCRTVSTGVIIVCRAGTIPVVDADGATVLDCIPEGQSCTDSYPVAAVQSRRGSVQVVQCLPQLQTCPPNFNTPLYAPQANSSTLADCWEFVDCWKIAGCWETDMLSSCDTSDGAAAGFGGYNISILDSSGATIGCIQNNVTACPASFPEARYSNGKLVKCKALLNCWSENAVDIVDATGKVIDCWLLWLDLVI